MPRPLRELPDRRGVLRIGALGGLLGLGAATGLTGCSAEQRDALLAVDPRDVRLDGDDPPVPPRPRPSARERRRLLVLSGSLAALQAWSDVGEAAPGLRGAFGGQAERVDAVAVHQAHVALLSAGEPRPPRTDRLGVLALDDGGPALPAPLRPAAVVGAGADVALRASEAERAEPDADVDLAVLHARIAAARGAQADALVAAADGAGSAGAGAGVSGAGAGAGAGATVWPTADAGPGLVDALQAVLALEHRAAWSYGVVLAWSTGRSDDARRARTVHADRATTLTSLVARLGAEPVAGLATYPTDDDGAPVDGPGTAAGLALRLEADLATACASVLTEAVAEGRADWTAAAVAVLATAERGRWSWGGAPQPLPGG